MKSLAEMQREGEVTREEIRQSIVEATNQARAFAHAEREYKKAKAVAWAKLVDQKMLAEHRKAAVDAECADLGYERDLAYGLRKSAWSATDALKGVLSSVQTDMNAYKAEADLVRTSSREFDG